MSTHPPADAGVLADLAPTGALRASINLGNPVLAQGTADAPSGVTVDLSREIAARLGVPVAFVCFDAARKSFEALISGAADIGYLAIEPAREAEADFTAPYAVIEGVYAVPDGAAFATAEGVDREGVRVGVKLGSAYDLFLSRTLERAEIVRGADGIDVFREQGLDVAAGIRQPLTRHAQRDGLRILEPRFMEIRQAVAFAKGHRPETLRFARDLVEELKANGFVADSIARSGQDVTVAPPG